jgi:hypothetical protein
MQSSLRPRRAFLRFDALFRSGVCAALGPSSWQLNIATYRRGEHDCSHHVVPHGNFRMPDGRHQLVYNVGQDLHSCHHAEELQWHRGRRPPIAQQEPNDIVCVDHGQTSSGNVTSVTRFVSANQWSMVFGISCLKMANVASWICFLSFTTSGCFSVYLASNAASFALESLPVGLSVIGAF